MTQKSMYHGGLVFLDEHAADIDQFCRIATATLEDYGHRVERQRIHDAHSARVTTNLYSLELSLDEPRYRDTSATVEKTGDFQHRLEISLIPAADGYEDRDISELMMVVMLYRMVDICATESIEWMDPGTVLTVDQFLSAFTNVSPHRVRGSRNTGHTHPRFASVDDTVRDIDDHFDEHAKAAEQAHLLSDEEALARAFRENEDGAGEIGVSPEEKAQSDIRRLATWGLTGMVAVLSTPVAASMAAVNLARGEDFRLNTQVLSLTGLLVVLNSTGLLSQIVHSLPI